MGSVAAAGQVTILYGGPNGLQPDAGPGSQFFNEDAPGLLGGPAMTKDWFSAGNSLGADFNGDGFMDLAVCVMYRDVAGLPDAGAFDVIYGGPKGLAVGAGPGNQYFDANTSGLQGLGAQAYATLCRAVAQAAGGGGG